MCWLFMPEVRALHPLRGSLHTEGTENAPTLNAHWVCRARVAQTQEPHLPPARHPGRHPHRARQPHSASHAFLKFQKVHFL